MSRKFRNEVLQHLSPTRWKAPLDIIDEIEKRRVQEHRLVWLRKLFPFLHVMIVTPSLGSVHVTLDRLEDDGLAEHRMNFSAEVMEKRGGRPVPEWRLTNAGHRRRINSPTTTDRPSVGLRPQTS